MLGKCPEAYFVRRPRPHPHGSGRGPFRERFSDGAWERSKTPPSLSNGILLKKPRLSRNEPCFLLPLYSSASISAAIFAAASSAVISPAMKGARPELIASRASAQTGV